MSQADKPQRSDYGANDREIIIFFYRSNLPKNTNENIYNLVSGKRC